MLILFINEIITNMIHKLYLLIVIVIATNSGTSKTPNLTSLKRQSLNINEDQTKARQSVILDDLTPPQSSEENSFIDYDSYLEENIGTGSDSFILPPLGGIKREKKQKKKPKVTGELKLMFYDVNN